MIENLASTIMKKRGKKDDIELFLDFQKAYDNANHSLLEEHLDVYGFPPGILLLIIEMMARWKIPILYRVMKYVGEVRLENGIIQGDSFSPLLFVLTNDPLIKILKKRVDEAEILFFMDDLKAAVTNIQTAQLVHDIVKRYAASVGMVINTKKSGIKLSVETPLQESL